MAKFCALCKKKLGFFNGNYGTHENPLCYSCKNTNPSQADDNALKQSSKNKAQQTVSVTLGSNNSAEVKELDIRQILTADIKNGNIESVARIIKNGTDVNLKLTSEGWSILHSACWHNKLDLISELLNLGADANAKDENGYTPLILYLRRSFLLEPNLDVLGILAKHGADFNLRTKDGLTPLHLILSEYFTKEKAKIVEQLIYLGADIEGRNKKGHTPMEYAVIKGEKAYVDLLDKYYKNKPEGFYKAIVNNIGSLIDNIKIEFKTGNNDDYNHVVSEYILDLLLDYVNEKGLEIFSDTHWMDRFIVMGSMWTSVQGRYYDVRRNRVLERPVLYKNDSDFFQMIGRKTAELVDKTRIVFALHPKQMDAVKYVDSEFGRMLKNGVKAYELPGWIDWLIKMAIWKFGKPN